jgi:hypothetical protein
MLRVCVQRLNNETHQTLFLIKKEVGWESNGGCKLVQSSLYMCMELSQ